MKGDPKIIEFLNGVLCKELTAINQYFLHARMLDDWGLARLGAEEYKASIDEMKHADELVKRILFLEGLPNLQKYEKINIGQSPKEVIESDLAFEKGAIDYLKEAIAYSESIRDFVSRDLFASILESEEEHIDWLETLLDQIKHVGLENFLQSQMGIEGQN